MGHSPQSENERPHLQGGSLQSSAPAASTFTPGPWCTQGWVPTWAYIPVKDARHNLVCSLYPDVGHGYTREEVQANATLIAEAPAMLAALRNVQKLIAEAAMTGFNCHDGDWAERLFASQHVTSTAIRKATGAYK